MQTILVVDDTSTNLVVIGELLQPYYRVRVANSGAKALRAAATDPKPDLILLDVMMPEMDGYAVIRALKQSPETKDTPVIFVTAMDGDDDEEKGLELGAVDYVTKPIKPKILLARVKTHLELKHARDWLADQKSLLETQVGLRTAENELIKDVSLNALALLAEKRDNETGNHLHRTQAYVRALIEKLKKHPKFSAELTDTLASQIIKAAPLHDIGKVGIPDNILLKPGKLTAEEFEIMKGHSAIGGNAIDEAIRRVASVSGETNSHTLTFLEVAKQIALHHHEKWNGTGYPSGLAGTDIPLSARLMAVADVFDALINKRHYKEAFPEDQTRRIILEGKGQHFDPDIVDAFIELESDFLQTARDFADIRNEG